MSLNRSQRPGWISSGPKPRRSPNGRPKPEAIDGLSIAFRPPAEVRAAYTERHRSLLEMLGRITAPARCAADPVAPDWGLGAGGHLPVGDQVGQAVGLQEGHDP